MKTRTLSIILLASVFFLFTEILYSQQSKFFAAATGGISVPYRLDGAPYKTGLNAGMRAGYIYSDHLATGLSLTYNSYENFTSPYITDISNSSIMQYRIYIMLRNFKSRSKAALYGLVSAGADVKRSPQYRLTDGTVIDGSSDWNPAIDIGGGVLYRASKQFEIFLEPQTGIPLSGNNVTLYINLKTGFNYMF